VLYADSLLTQIKIKASFEESSFSTPENGVSRVSEPTFALSPTTKSP